MSRTMLMATWRLRTPLLFRKPAGTAVLLVPSCSIRSYFVSSFSNHVLHLRRYGLLASVLASRRVDFDKFLIYYNEQENDQGLSCWQQASCTFCVQLYCAALQTPGCLQTACGWSICLDHCPTLPLATSGIAQQEDFHQSRLNEQRVWFSHRW